MMLSQALVIASATAFVAPRNALRRTPPLHSAAADWRKTCDAGGVVSFFDYGVRLGGEEAPAREQERTPIFPFDAAPEATAALWERIDDVVMGGVSSSKIVAGDSGAEWRGIVRTDGGGFCGTRTSALDAPLDLSKAKGVYVDAVLTSDADIARRAWKLTLRTGASRSEVVYSAEWAPCGPDGKGEPSFVPFSAFRLVRGPRIVEGAPPLNASACEKVFGFGLTLSRFGPAAKGGGPLEDFRDGPFVVKLNAVGAYGPELVKVPALGKSGDASRPNSAQYKSPMKTNGLVLGLVLTLLRPLANLVFSEEARRRGQARRTLVKGNKCASGWQARLYGQRVVKRMRGLGAGAALTEGLAQFAKDALVFVLALPLRFAFKAVFGTVRIVRRLRGKRAMPAL